LKRLRTNLDTLRILDDDRIPRELAWRKANGHWAALICREIPGEELNSTNATSAVLTSLGDLLLRLHSVEDPGQPVAAPSGRVNEPDAFPAFRAMLVRRLADLPIRMERVQRHLDAMSTFLAEHAGDFSRPKRLIHGDLHRSNIISTGKTVGLLDWGDLTAGDYAYDLATMKFVLDAVVPRRSASVVRERARLYRERFNDKSLQTRLRFFLALAGLVRAFHCADDASAFRPGRAWRVRACYLHSEAQWSKPLELDGVNAGAPSMRTEEWALDMRQPLRGLFYLVAPRRVS
jgi:aminoglycoside phosphotransferase (APT) family kinase protein